MSAKFLTSEVTKLVEVKEKQVTGVLLELTLEEAQMIVEMISMFGGHPSNTARKYIESISDKLAYLGIGWNFAGSIRTDTCYFNVGSDKQISDYVQCYKVAKS